MLVGAFIIEERHCEYSQNGRVKGIAVKPRSITSKATPSDLACPREKKHTPSTIDVVQHENHRRRSKLHIPYLHTDPGIYKGSCPWSRLTAALQKAFNYT